MPAPYSEDLRKKVMDCVDSGESINAAARKFYISRKSVKKWLTLRANTSSIAPKKGYQKGHGHKIVDLNAFKKFADEHAGETCEMMAQAWGNVSDTTIGKALKKIGYTQKKRPLAT